MIRRLLVLLIAVVVAVWWFRRKLAELRARTGGLPASGGTVRDLGPMVRDRVCNTFLPRSRALVLRIEGEEHHFCSEACREKFLAQSGAEIVR